MKNNLKNKIILELEKKEFPDLEFLFSEEVLDNSLDFLRELLEEEKQKFEKLLKTKKENINFDIFEDDWNLSYFWHLLNHLQWVNSGDKINGIIDEFEPEYIDFANEISYSKDYFDMLVFCLENCDLDEEQTRIMEERIKSFKLRWINLEKEKQEKLKEISKKLSKLSQDFTNNIVKDKKKWTYHIDDFEIIKDLPEASLSQAKKIAEKEKKEWYIFSSDPNLMWDIMEYCSSSKVRKDFLDASVSFASSWEFDNREIVLEILKLKKEKSDILWYKNYAELSLVRKMADSPEQVLELIEWISKKSKKKAEIEIETLKKYFSLEDLKSWDVSYYSSKYKKEFYNIDNKEIKKYFEFDEVLKYLHSLVEKLYSLELKQVEVPSYDKDIKIYEVYRNDKLISYYFLDAFYREAKRPWAWADNIRTKDYINEKIPVITNVCNFQNIKVWENLLSMRDVETLFHEFWHALHEMLSESKYSELSGFWVEWDFVELPSQIHENWVGERESLKKLASHYKTWKSLSEEVLDKLDDLKTYNSGLFVTRQNEFALLDMYLHTLEVPKNIWELDKKTLDLSNKFWIFKRWEDYKMYTSFGHIFGWGYSAGYYSYMWAEILEADVFEKIKEMWMFNRETWEKFVNTILWQWTRKPAKDLFFDFMWREVSDEAFLKRKWLI